MSARNTALAALIACRRQKAWSDNVLKSYIDRDGLDRRDAALAQRICFGVQQNRMLLDHYLGQCLNGNLSSLQPVVLDILRIGAYQLLLLEKIPESAAVNEAVEQGKKYANARAAGLINAVLRRLIREKERLAPPEELSVRYSHSAELTELLRENIVPELLEPLLAAHNEAPSSCIQVNTLRAETAQILQMLPEAEPHPWLDNCILLAGNGDPSRLECFREGLIYVQDAAARLAVTAADPQPGNKVLDCCAAPGGKSFAAAIAMHDRGSILSCDLHENKLYKISDGARRLGIGILSTMAHDAREYRKEWDGGFDVVLADVPCSGLGVIRKKPDIRDKDLSRIAELPGLQKEILNTVCRYVAPHGVLLYSTCTILKRENEAVIEDFLRSHTDFAAEDFSLCGRIASHNGQVTLLPCVHGTDGFYIAKLRKIK